MLLKNNWTAQPVLFFGGKGGTGKTTFSSAVSVYLSEKKSRKTLLISTDPAHNLSDIFQKKIHNKKTRITAKLDAIELDAELAARRYIRQVKDSMLEYIHPRFYSAVDSYLEFARVSPGLQEAALLDSLSDTILEGQSRYESIVVDTAPTGHSLRLILLPDSMKQWTGLLLKKRRNTAQVSDLWKFKEKDSDLILNVLEKRESKYRKMKELILDPEKTSMNFVLNPDAFSFEETKRAAKTLKKAGISVSRILINKVIAPTKDPFLSQLLKEQQRILHKIEKWAPKNSYRFFLSATPVYGLNALKLFID